MRGDIDEQPFKERLKEGVLVTQQMVFDRLTALNGAKNVILAPTEKDIFEKFDIYFYEKICSIKGRADKDDGGDDLLSQIAGKIVGKTRFPYSGHADLLVTGRDSKEYHKVFCLNKAESYIRVFDGPFVRYCNETLVEEYKSRYDKQGDFLKRSSTMTSDKLVFKDEKGNNWTCQLKSWIDSTDGYLKVCSFIPEKFAEHHKALEKIYMKG